MENGSLTVLFILGGICVIVLIYAFIKLAKGLSYRKNLINSLRTPDTVSDAEIRSERSLNALQEVLRPKVLSHLKSPASAILCPPTEMSIERKDGLFVVKGYVDSQNDFGAMKRGRFTAKCTYDAQYKFWLCVSVFVYE